MSVSKYLVITPHVSEYPTPITFQKGAFLTVGEKYEGKEDWENWFFCSAPGQEPGWVPGQIIEFLVRRHVKLTPRRHGKLTPP
ncbi:hypothetical protein HOP57_18580 [Halomonas daqingensis]|nr:SH3 domain-containing protein [Halomonas desiderata]MCE8013535.1 hypothetical protein [Halomonas desiderata]